MGYREDVCVAYTEAGWKFVVDYINSENLTDEHRVDIIDFLNAVDEHHVSDNNEHCLSWEYIKTYADDSKILFQDIHFSLPDTEYFMLSLGEDGAEESDGSWCDNPFGLSICRSLNKDVDNSVVWTSCNIKKPIPKPVSAAVVADMSTLINDHTCSSCGNTACSKTEKSCWKCGHPIVC